MDATVSARVPVEIKKQADKKLRQMGSSTTELINAAYCYLIAENDLPRPQVRKTDDDGGDDLSPEQRDRLRDFLAQTTFHVADDALANVADGEASVCTGEASEQLHDEYGDIIASGRLADYETLA